MRKNEIWKDKDKRRKETIRENRLCERCHKNEWCPRKSEFISKKEENCIFFDDKNIQKGRLRIPWLLGSSPKNDMGEVDLKKIWKYSRKSKPGYSAE
ncbi:MAG: hypothetical protein HWN65_23130 [Candidatus Helarchaeota archaeon]|nr:hypothetical protein [Candidatus Helarchaeota archaeon]